MAALPNLTPSYNAARYSTMHVIEQTRPAEPGLSSADLEALFEEARRHRRQRRARLALAVAGALVLALAVYALLARGARSSSSTAGGGSGGLVASLRPRVIILAVDVSGSMAATDIHPTRLQATVTAVDEFARALPDEVQVGLVSFNDTSKLLLPPTTSRAKLRSAVASLFSGSGTALGDGLTTATASILSALKQSHLDHKQHGLLPAAVVLVSDGAQNRGSVTPLAAAKHARADGIRIYGISLGTKTGSVSLGAGEMVSRVPVPPDPKDVREISTVTGGSAFDAQTAAALDADLKQLAGELSR
jgi:Mg-chelatase subunit ChlD